MSVADPELMVKNINLLNVNLGKFNKVVSGLTRVIDKNIRAQTKVVAAANKTHGMMMGVVADLELRGGAFGKIKRYLANILLPVTEDTPKFFKYAQGLMSLSNAYTNLWTPFKRHLKGVKEQSKAEKALDVKAQGNFLTRLMGGSLSLKTFKKSTLSGLGPMTPLGPSPLADAVGLAPTQMRPPKEFTRFGLGPLEKPGVFERLKGGAKNLGISAKHVAAMGSSKVKTGMKMWKTNVTTPLKQIASGGIGLGFQVYIIMGLMQAFGSLFAIFQPIMDIVGLLMERLSIGFIPIVTMLIDIITSPPVLAIIDALSLAMYELFTMFKPFVPIINKIIEAALTPFTAILERIAPLVLDVVTSFVALIAAVLTPTFMEVFGMIIEVILTITTVILNVLKPVFDWLGGLDPSELAKIVYVFGLALSAIWGFMAWGGPIGAAIAAGLWAVLMSPLLSFQMGTDYVPQTGMYYLHEGEAVITSEENRAPTSSPIVINMYGSYLGADMEDLSNRIAKKLSLYRF